MGLRRIVRRQSPVKELVRLGIWAGQADPVGLIIFLGKEATGAQNDHGQAMFGVSQPAQLLRRKLGHPIDVAGFKGCKHLVEPSRFVAIRRPDRRRDHE